MRVSNQALKTLKGRSKYRNLHTSCGDHQHASKKEAIRCGDLQLLVKGKVIDQLEQQPRFSFSMNDVKICDYVADFQWRDRRTGIVVVEDVKGVKTAVYQLKKKLMRAFYGIEIKET